ncbi:MAG: regulatory protein RecX [Alloprevotella sp.]|nr:regulatory protein RecX [Alloprevotella sp.]
MTLSEAYSWAARRCALRELCPFDIEQKLRQRDTAEADIFAVIDRLVEEKYIDIQRYASAFIRDKIRFDHWGRHKVAYALRMKDIPERYIREALQEIDAEEYRSILCQVLAGKQRTVRGKSEWDCRQKVAAFAQRRGFELDLIFELLEDLND